MVDMWRSQVLLSTGELTTEVRTRVDGRLLYESAPAGSTVGVHEQVTHTRNDQFFEEILATIPDNASQRTFDDAVVQFGTALSAPASLLYLRAQAERQRVSLAEYLNPHYTLPRPILNVINGGKHAGGNIPLCEFMLLPERPTFRENVEYAAHLYRDLGEMLGKARYATGREGGYVPPQMTVESALALMSELIERNGGDCGIGIDVAAGDLARGDRYELQNGDRLLQFSSSQLLDFYSRLKADFPRLNYLEDPFHEHDIAGWQRIVERHGDGIAVAADDLTGGSVEHMQARAGLYNTVVLKTNQSGTFSALADASAYAVQQGIPVVISQRSGETDTSTTAELAAGLGATFVKIGAPARERIVKYNQLLRLEDERR